MWYVAKFMNHAFNLLSCRHCIQILEFQSFQRSTYKSSFPRVCHFPTPRASRKKVYLHFVGREPFLGMLHVPICGTHSKQSRLSAVARFLRIGVEDAPSTTDKNAHSLVVCFRALSHNDRTSAFVFQRGGLYPSERIYQTATARTHA